MIVSFSSRYSALAIGAPVLEFSDCIIQ